MISCAKHFKVFQAVNYQSVILIYICIFIISAVCWGRVSWVWIGSGSSGRLGRRTNQPVVNSREGQIIYHIIHITGRGRSKSTQSVLSYPMCTDCWCNSPNSNDLPIVHIHTLDQYIRSYIRSTHYNRGLPHLLLFPPSIEMFLCYSSQFTFCIDP